MPSRSRAKGRRGGEVERFAKLPCSVLESEAVSSLNHAAFRILVHLAAGYWGGNNGALAFTPTYAKRFGFTSRQTIYDSLKDLESRGLIECTRRGMKIKNVFSLYALGWVPINNRNGMPLERPERPPNAWTNWRSEPELVPIAKNIHTEGQTQSVPDIGITSAKSVPMRNTTAPELVPTEGNTLRISVGGVHHDKARPETPCRARSIEK
jgi:hypothetical protein